MKIVKVLSILFICFFISQNVKAQSTEEAPQVKLLRTGSRGVSFSSDYFSKEDAEQILQQISQSDFEHVKKFMNEGSYPSCPRHKLDNDGKLDELFIRRIAVFDHYYNGRKFNNEAILMISPGDNPENENCVTHTFYIIMNNKDVELVE